MITASSKSDVDIKNDVLAELLYVPGSEFGEIAVNVKDGVVNLKGSANSYTEKWDAVAAAQRVWGVKSVDEDIFVVIPDFWTRTDADLTIAANQQLKWSSIVPEDSVQADVVDGWLTLKGNVQWWFQKHGAEKAVHNLIGIKGLTNLVSISPKASSTGIGASIESAFKRSATLDASGISVHVLGDKVTLKGDVRNYAEIDQAGRAAWSAPGVLSVDNQLMVDYNVDFG